jgi:hypothetical protein
MRILDFIKNTDHISKILKKNKLKELGQIVENLFKIQIQ